LAQLVYVQLETSDYNPDGVAWYAYFDGEPTKDELGKVFDNKTLVDGAPLGYELEDAEELPSPLSKHTGLRRYYVAMAC
jgi:hypothetical protein